MVFLTRRMAEELRLNGQDFTALPSFDMRGLFGLGGPQRYFPVLK